MREYKNVYQTARELKGLTQEAAAERLDISVESLGAYEQDRRRPPDSTVLRMAQLYDFPYLCYQHLQTGNLGGVLPSIQCKPLEQATMRLVRLIGAMAHEGRLGQLMEIAEDGIITDDERPIHNDIMAELEEIVRCYFELEYAENRQKKTPVSVGVADECMGK